MKNTVYCLLPSNSLDTFVDPDNSSVLTITPPESKTLKVVLDKQSFRSKYCDGCELKITEKELSSSMKAAKIMSSSLNKITYCNQHNLCTSSDQMLALCPAGHSLSSFIEVTVNVPKLVWVYNWDASGKEQFKLFAVKEQQNEGLLVTPYLLSNVYTKPLACISWPKNQPRPSNLKTAYHTFWDSPFSDESWVVDNNLTYIEHLKQYDPFTSDTEKFISTSNLQHFTNTSGVFFTQDPKMLESIPKRINNLGHALGSIKAGANSNWLITINNSLFNKAGKLTGTSKLTLIG